MSAELWRKRPFESVVRSRGSGSSGLPQKEWQPHGTYPVIGQGVEAIEGWTDREDLVLTPAPSVVLYGGHTRRAKHVSEPFVPGPNVKILRPVPELDSRFLFFFLTHLEVPSRGYADHFPAVRKCEIPFPPLAEQKRIVGILDEASDGIAAAEANAKQNLQNARALFESHLQCVFAQRGQGWVEKNFEELVESNVIGLSKSSREQGKDRAWPYVKMSNITSDNRFDFSSFVTVDATDEEVRKFQLRNGDFLLNTRNSFELVGKSCVYEANPEVVSLYNNNIMRIRFVDGVDARFVLLASSSTPVAEAINALKSGTTNVSAIYFKDLRSLALPVAPIAVQRRIASELEELRAETQRLEANYQRKRAALAELKKSLLHQAFTGRLGAQTA